jgi:NitT/TauT family transport system ATP-binding protein
MDTVEDHRVTVAALSRPANCVSPPRIEKAKAVPLLSVKSVTLQYKTPDQLVTATYRVSFEVYAGDRFVLLGPSGCGKSSLLKAVGGFIEPVEGSIELGGKPIGRPGPDRMMVFQEFDQLLPWKTVRQNIV